MRRYHKNRARDPFEVSITSYGSLVFLKNNLRMTKLPSSVKHQPKERDVYGDDEVTRRAGNFVTLINIKKSGPRCWLRPNTALPTSRP